MITIKPEDVLRSVVVKNPGWFILEVKNYSTKPANSDQSTNHLWDLNIVSDLTGDTEYAGVPCKQILINEKGIYGNGTEFLKACGVPDSVFEDAKKGKMPQIDPQKCVGKKLKAFVQISTWEGRNSNEAKQFDKL